MTARRSLAIASRALAFALAFTLDIRAKAASHEAGAENGGEHGAKRGSEPAPKPEAARPVERASAPVAVVSLPEAARPVERPANCLQADVARPCAVATGRAEKLALPLEGGALVLDRSSTALREGANAAVFVDGGAWARAAGTIVVKVEFGEIEISAGEAWIWRDGGRVWIDALAGEVALAPRGGLERAALAPGMRNWLGPVGREGRAEVGFPRSLDFLAHLARWARVHPGPKARFEEDAGRLAESWREAVRSIASLDEERARARRLGLEAEERRKQGAILGREAQNRELRALFRRKTFEQ